MRSLFWIGAAVLSFGLTYPAASAATQSDTAQRILSVGGSVTEIIFALGQGDRVIARDTTSSFPPEASALPNVGYKRRLSPEGILSVDPDLIIAEDDSGPPDTIDILTEADIAFVKVPDGYDAAAIKAKILAVADALNVHEQGAALAEKIGAELEAAKRAASVAAPKRVMFVLSTRGGRIMASGTNTAADGIIALAGAENAVTAFEGYKLMTDEAIIAAAPDVILMMDRTGDHATETEELFAMPAMATVPAAQDGAVVRIDGLLLLGFGPRTPLAVLTLHDALYGD